MFKKIVYRAERFTENVNRLVARSSAAVIAVIIVLIIVDVVGRWALNKPLPGCTEITSSCLSYLAFMSYAYGLGQQAYVKVEVFFTRFPPMVQCIIELITNLCGLLVFYIILQGGWTMFIKSFLAKELMPASVEFPYWLPKMFVPLGSLLMCIQCLVYCLNCLCRLFSWGEETADE